jgi:hypothetical protein
MTRRGGISIAPWIAAALALPGGACPATSARGGDDVVATAEPPAEGQSFRVDVDQQLEGMLQGLRSADGVGGVPTPTEMRIAAIDAVCGLDQAQRDRCTLLAGVLEALQEASIARLRATYAGRVFDLGMPDGQQAWQRFHQEFAEIQQTSEAATGQRGVLSRLLVGMLDERQRGLWAEASRQRSADRLRDMLDDGLEGFVADVGLTSSQRDALAALTLDRPSRIDPERAMANLGMGNPFLFAYVLSTVDRQRIDELLDERQRTRVTKLLEDARAMIRHIETSCLIDE